VEGDQYLVWHGRGNTWEGGRTRLEERKELLLFGSGGPELGRTSEDIIFRREIRKKDDLKREPWKKKKGRARTARPFATIIKGTRGARGGLILFLLTKTGGQLNYWGSPEVTR